MMTHRSRKIRSRKTVLSGGISAVLLTTGTFALGATSSALPLAEAATTTPLAITVNVTDATGNVIPQDFLGLSFEWSNKEAYFGLSSTSRNLGTVRLLNALGDGSVRIGGWSGDGYHYVANQPSDFSESGGQYTGVFGPDAVKTVLRVASDAQWKVTLPCSSTKDSPSPPWNDPTSIDPSLAANCRAMLHYAVNDSGVGGALDGFEVGNERNAHPDVPPSKAQPPKLLWDDYRQLFHTFGHVTAQDSTVASVPMMGPATGGCNLDSAAPGYNYCTSTRSGNKPMSVLATDGTYGVGSNRIGYLSYHYYVPNPDTNADGTNVHDILSQAFMDAEKTQMRLAKTGAGSFRLRMNEGNSLSLGVATANPNIVDTQAAGLWGVDYLFTAASSGLAGVNFHNCRTGGLPCPYNAFGAEVPNSDHPGSYTVAANPLFYGMYLFKNAAGTQLIPTSPASTSDNIKVWATKDIANIPTGKRYKVWVINKGGNAQAVTLHPSTPTGTTGNLVGMITPNNDPSWKSPTIGGGRFDSAGNLQGSTATPVNANTSGDFTFTVPPYSAYLFSAGL